MNWEYTKAPNVNLSTNVPDIPTTVGGFVRAPDEPMSVEMFNRINEYQQQQQQQQQPIATTAVTQSSAYPTKAVTTKPITSGKQFGWLSRMSETGSEQGNHKDYTRNDGGGQSLGIYQLHSKHGSMGEFLDQSVAKANPELYSLLRSMYRSPSATYSPEFVEAWNKNESALVPLQHAWAKKHFYDDRLSMLSPAMRAKVEADPRLQEIFMSFNVNGSQESFNKVKQDLVGDDLINALYDYRTYGLDGSATPNYYKGFNAKMRKAIAANINRERRRILGE